jgi:hypothetical protein
MVLPDNPSGRELAAFADEVRDSIVVLSDCLDGDEKRHFIRTAQLLDDAADRAFSAEARRSIAAEQTLAAACTPFQGGNQVAGEYLRTCCDPGGTGEVAEHGFAVGATLQAAEPPATIVINVHGVTDPEAVSLAIAESMERGTRRRNMRAT